MQGYGSLPYPLSLGLTIVTPSLLRISQQWEGRVALRQNPILCAAVHFRDYAQKMEEKHFLSRPKSFSTHVPKIIKLSRFKTCQLCSYPTAQY